MELLIKILGGIAGTYLTYYVVNRGINSAALKKTNGKLYFGGFLLALAVVCTSIVLGVIYILFFIEHGSQEAPLTFLILMFGFFAIYSWLEYFGTKGFYNNAGIDFKSIWCGHRYGKWSNLKDVKYNQSAYWYVLHFNDDTKVRISVYLLGHRALINHLSNLGYDF